MEKRFNEQYCAFYYYNRKTGDIVWEKPKSLGSYDMVVVNEWRPMRDTQVSAKIVHQITGTT